MNNLKKNKILEEIRHRTPEETKLYVKRSYEIADRIQSVLKRKSKDQRFLADKLGKSESEISKWLSGTHNFTIKTLTKIEVALNEPIINVNTEKRIEHFGEPTYINVFAFSNILPMKMTFGGNYISSDEKHIAEVLKVSPHNLPSVKFLE